MTELRLYHAAPSRSMTVRWMLEEMGVPYELEVLDLKAGAHKRPEYLAINPMGRVPALKHGDRVVTETAAIVLYLSEVFPECGLGVEAGAPERGDFLRWLFFCPVSAEPSILWRALGDAVAGLDYQPFASVEDVANMLRVGLGGRDYIVGDRFTAADIMVGSTIMWGTRLMPVLPKLPELVAYWDRLESRPGWQRAHRADSELMAAH